jgi:hypothetical protein
MWRAWSASRNEEVLRHPDRAAWSGLTWLQRVERMRDAAVVNGGFVGLLLLPFLVSAGWSLLPGWFNEARVYQAIGKATGAAFVVLMLLALLGDLAEKVDAVQRHWQQWRRRSAPWSWPGFQASASRVIEVLIAVFIAWFAVSLVMTLPAAWQPELIVVAELLFARVVLALLDRVWQQLDATDASVRRKLIVLVWPLILGIGLAALLVVHTNEPWLARATSATLFVTAVGAGLTLGLLRLLRRG